MSAVTEPAPIALGLSPHITREVDGGVLLIRNAQRISGAALIFASVGLWLFPGTSWEPDLALMKLLVSLALGFAGIAFLQEGRTSTVPEIELDLTREEVRVIRRAGRDARMVVCYAFSELGPVEDHGETIRLCDPDGALLVDMPVPVGDVRDQLLAKLLNRA
ncbi:MAG: hypothetical protein HRU30_02920 [Rhodobacteraceae bacterium]|nr:hypothetical protein [Paracoccaceae bacterium]